MMKYNLLISFLLLFCISCQSDKELNQYSNPYTDLSPEEYLKNYTTPEVMFHYVKSDKDASSLNGILIDNKGHMYKYHSESPVINLDEVTVSVSELVMLMTHSERLESDVDLEELVAHYKMTRKVDLKLQASTATIENEDFYFVGYDVTHDSEGNETCNVIGVSGDVYIQKTFKSSKNINNSQYANLIVNWMTTIIDKANL